MTSTRPQRKGQPPTPLPLHPSPASAPKQIISVEEWEAKAPLGDLEIRSINAIKAAAEKVPFPLKFAEEEDSSPSGAATPVIQQPRNKFVASASGSGSRPSTPSGRSNTHALHPKQPVQTPQQFYDWFALIDRSVAHSQESHFRAHVASVSEHLETCDLLLDRIGEIDREVDGMMEGWKGVEEGGKNLKDACERLLEERDRLLELTDDIGSYLEYFQELEPATRMLNHPGESLIFQSDFLYMVERVDICIDFLKTHRHFKESEVYLLRFQQCMTRAMTLIKMNFVGSLRALSSDVSNRLSEKDVSPTAQMHLLYTRFKTVSKKVAPLLGELERRALAYPDELSALLSECHSAYFSVRKHLLVPRILEEIKGLDPSRSELVELTRAGCSYLKQLCTDEFNLYREFFSTAEDQLYQYLETLCDFLYDDLRPRILHEPRLTALCEVCTVLQALMVLDAPSSSSTLSSSNGDEDESSDDESADQSENENEDDDLTVDLDNPHPKGKGKVGRRLHISHLLQMVLQDAQTRLFFKAQSVIQSDIRYYVPKPEDLAYPDILISARKPQSANEIREKESVSQIFQLPSLDKQDTWYPTMRKMVWVLSQLHDFVKPAIFEDIAQEAANLCRQSLVAASEAIKTRSGLDGHLFLVRNLLILKEITRNLDLDQRNANEPSSSKAADFGGVTETFANLLSRTTSMLPDGLFASLGVTRGEDSIRGVKHGIDHQLRGACEDVISACVDSICEPLQSWAERIHTYKSTPPSLEKHSTAGDLQHSPRGPLADQDWASRSTAENLNLRFREACERDMRSSVARLRLYLEDDRTVRVLVEHMQDRIMDAYAAYREVVLGMYAGTLREREGVLSPIGLREVLRDVCGEGKGVDQMP